MRNVILISIITLLGIYSTSAQVGIGKKITQAGVLLDFEDTNSDNKGIILPIVTVDSLNLTYSNGTILVDNHDQIIKIREEGKWKKLTDAGSFDEVIVGGIPYTTAANFSTTLNESLTSKIVIGDSNSTTDGILVLESATQAMVLPKVESPHTNMALPVAGTICYDTDAKALAIFDGKVWSYWK